MLLLKKQQQHDTRIFAQIVLARMPKRLWGKYFIAFSVGIFVLKV